MTVLRLLCASLAIRRAESFDISGTSAPSSIAVIGPSGEVMLESLPAKQADVKKHLSPLMRAEINAAVSELNEAAQAPSGRIQKCQTTITWVEEVCSTKSCDSGYTETGVSNFRRRRLFTPARRRRMFNEIQPCAWFFSSKKRECSKCKPCMTKEQIKSVRGKNCGTFRDPTCDKDVVLGDCANGFECQTLTNTCIKKGLDYAQMRLEIDKVADDSILAESAAKKAWNDAEAALDDARMAKGQAKRAASDSKDAKSSGILATNGAKYCAGNATKSGTAITALSAQMAKVKKALADAASATAFFERMSAEVSEQIVDDGDDTDFDTSSDDEADESLMRSSFIEFTELQEDDELDDDDDDMYVSLEESDDADAAPGDGSNCKKHVKHVEEDCNVKHCGSGWKEVQKWGLRRRRWSICGPSYMKKCEKCYACRGKAYIIDTLKKNCGPYVDPHCDQIVQLGECNFGSNCVRNVCQSTFDLPQAKKDLLDATSVADDASQLAHDAAMLEASAAKHLIVALQDANDAASDSDIAGELSQNATKKTADTEAVQTAQLKTLADLESTLKKIKQHVASAGTGTGSLNEVDNMLEDNEQADLLLEADADTMDFSEVYDEEADADVQDLREEDDDDTMDFSEMHDEDDDDDDDRDDLVSSDNVNATDINSCEKDWQVVEDTCSNVASCPSGFHQRGNCDVVRRRRRRRWTLKWECEFKKLKRKKCAKCKPCHTTAEVKTTHGKDCGEWMDKRCAQKLNLGACGSDSNCERNTCVKKTMTFEEFKNVNTRALQAVSGAFADSDCSGSKASKKKLEAADAVTAARKAEKNSADAKTEAGKAFNLTKACGVNTGKVEAKINSIKTSLNAFSQALNNAATAR